ncbi:MAG: hydrogenase maturation nickel metallochaperone HypA [Chloroflexi bacterium]|nr:hydrogenase maturation nickel metallochaperone HypA [Chloroflexota bacterium]
MTQSILDIAVDYASRAGASQVTHLYLVIGKLSSFVDDSVQFYWDMISQGTICEGGQLHFERLPARLACLDCGTDYTLDSELVPCPKCGSSRVKILSGEEFRLDSIEVLS